MVKKMHSELIDKNQTIDKLNLLLASARESERNLKDSRLSSDKRIKDLEYDNYHLEGAVKTAKGLHMEARTDWVMTQHMSAKDIQERNDAQYQVDKLHEKLQEHLKKEGGNLLAAADVAGQ